MLSLGKEFLATKRVRRKSPACCSAYKPGKQHQAWLMKKRHARILEPLIVCLDGEKDYFLLLHTEVSSEKASSLILLETLTGRLRVLNFKVWGCCVISSTSLLFLMRRGWQRALTDCSRNATPEKPYIHSPVLLGKPYISYQRLDKSHQYG